jgi:uncharacterized membrane protein (UPF0127 family)
MKKAASLLPALLAAGLGVAGARAETTCPPERAETVWIGSQRFSVEVAGTEAERQQGLSGRNGLAADAGMWFVMPGPGHYAFWMQGMAFAIDLVWIDAEAQVLDAVRMEPCPTLECPAYAPPAPASYVLEVSAGRFAGRPGDRVDWRCPPP